MPLAFDEQLLFSSKLFNLRAFMARSLTPSLPVVASLPDEPSETAVLAKRKRAMAHMMVCRVPEKGTGHLERGPSPSLDLYEELDSYEDS